MTALFFGLLFLLFTVFAVLPFDWSLQWWPYVVDFLKGAVPVMTLIIGLIAVLIGIADIRDKVEEDRDESEKEDEEASDR